MAQKSAVISRANFPLNTQVAEQNPKSCSSLRNSSAVIRRLDISIEEPKLHKASSPQTMKARNSPFPSAKRLKLCNEQTVGMNAEPDPERDYTSNLSDTLLRHILSFLDTKYAVQTCILAKRWRYLWNSLPTLRFNHDIFSARSRTYLYDGFQDFNDNILALRDNSDIKRFHYYGYGKRIPDDPLHKWILAVLRRNVEEMYFDIRFDEIQFPKCLFTSNSLTKLIMETGGTDSYEHKQFKFILPDSLDLPQLKILHLDSVSFVQEDSTNKLFSSCPNLESLSITNSEFRQMNVSISSPKLKYLRLENNCKNFRLSRSLDSTFKLDTPNVTSFTCKDYTSKDYILGNFSSVVKADIQMKAEEGEVPWTYKNMRAKRKQMYAQRMMAFLKALSNVEDLRLSAWLIRVVSGVPNLLGSQLTQFCHLRCLKLEIWRCKDSMVGITCLLNVSPLIESLFVNISQWDFYAEEIGHYKESGLSLQCPLHHLKFVEIQGIAGCNTEFKFLEILLKNALVLEKLMVFGHKELSPSREDRMNFSEKLLTLSRASSNVTVFVF